MKDDLVVALVKTGSIKEALIVIVDMMVKMDNDIKALEDKIETLMDVKTRSPQKREHSGLSIG